MNRAPLEPEDHYRAFGEHDARLDGRVFVGVSSTGIYCRPVCRARNPKPTNCAFFRNAAAAEAAGYRPCLRCRPELAPAPPATGAAPTLAQRAALLMDSGAGADGPGEAAQALGVTSAHLRRLFTSEYGVSPLEYLQTQRLLLAKSLLTDTRLPLAEVAHATGLGSARRLEELFRDRYRLSPGALRRRTPQAGRIDDDSVTLYLGYRPPYLWDALLTFLGERAIPGVETVTDRAYQRTVYVRRGEKAHRGWLAVRHAEPRHLLAVTVSATLLPALPAVLSRVAHLFDLRCDPCQVHERLAAMNEISDGVSVCGTRLPGSFDPFEMAVRAILGQQITVKAARTLAGRVAAAFGRPLTTPVEGLTHTFPTPADICALDGRIENHLGRLGVIGARARSIRALAEGLLRGDLELSRSADHAAEMKKLLALPGFGPWTVQYLAMRALGWPDAFPHTDHGVRTALGGRAAAEILELAEQWRPWRSYATVNLWNSLQQRRR